jgi:hypothetical protein
MTVILQKKKKKERKKKKRERKIAEAEVIQTYPGLPQTVDIMPSV